MLSHWNEQEAARFAGVLGPRVYSSRLLGREPALALHGGGNTSVKLTSANLFGEPEELLYVKGSGRDLDSIDETGFAPLRLDYVRRLAQLPALSDPQMVNELRTQLTRASAPTPSVEAILHAILPYRYVDHTHAEAVITITNTANGLERIREIYGEEVVVVPYVMPGFDLARRCAQEFERQRHAGTIGMVLMNHGLFSFGESARESYERTIALVTRAEEYLARHGAWQLPAAEAMVEHTPLRLALANLRRELSSVAGFPAIVRTERESETLAFARRADVAVISQQGPITPDHVIRTKRVPMIGRDVAAYAAAYREYFNTHAPLAREPKTALDPAPRVVLDPEFGLCTIGRNARDAQVVRDLYRQTMRVVARGALLGGYQALPARDIFDVEYWDLEQAKLASAGAAPLFAGEIALVTGAASGIGRSCVESLLARGAAVVGLDINPAIETLKDVPAWLGLVCDVTDARQLEAALERAVQNFGGLDMLVLNAGVFPPGRPIAETDFDEWRRVQEINLNANLALLHLAHPLLKLAPNGARVVVIGSKNVHAPGPGAAAYSAAKAGLNQLARIAALEWAADHIRVNSLHPDAVFDTGIWSEEVLMARAAHYGMTVEQYRRRNLLKVEITSRDVAELAAELCGPRFAKTTAAQVPIDGGDPRVI